MVKHVILDASAWLAVLLQEKDSDWISGHLERQALFAPELIRYEAANGLLYAYRKRHLLNKQVLESLLKVARDFPIETIPLNVWWKEATRVVTEYSLTFYDASYLSAAVVLKMPLLTLDGQMIDVMKHEKIHLLAKE